MWSILLTMTMHRRNEGEPKDKDDQLMINLLASYTMHCNHYNH